MPYRADKDLDFLGQISSQDLNDLVFCLTHDRDGKIRWTEQLTVDSAYQQHFPNHHKYWQQIAAEVQLFGGNTIANVFRGGEGVMYRETLMNVCDKVKANYNKASNIVVIEQNLLMRILTDAMDHMTPEELAELARATGTKHASALTPQALTVVFQAVFRAGGVMSLRLTYIIVNMVAKAILGRGLTLATNTVLLRTVAIITGPAGWIATGLWTAFDIASPAYRVTIPAVLHIAVLRQKYLASKATAGNP